MLRITGKRYSHSHPKISQYSSNNLQQQKKRTNNHIQQLTFHHTHCKNTHNGKNTQQDNTSSPIGIVCFIVQSECNIEEV